jgi:tRNA threonylcarbamoyladenosine biosynthesis protein TsaE
MRHNFVITTKTPEETQSFGSDMAKTLKNGSIISLYGTLGSGKTQLVKGICKGLGVEQTVNSPTFIIVNEYTSPQYPLIYHFDLYRMKSLDEIIDMGFRDYLENGDIILIEWPQHVENILPDDTIKIRLAHTNEDENSRWIKMETL